MPRYESYDEKVKRIAKAIADLSKAAECGVKKTRDVNARYIMREIFGYDQFAKQVMDDILCIYDESSIDRRAITRDLLRACEDGEFRLRAQLMVADQNDNGTYEHTQDVEHAKVAMRMHKAIAAAKKAGY